MMMRQARPWSGGFAAMPTVAVDPTVLDRVVAALTQVPAGLLTDIDGTISKIAPTAELARAEPSAVAALARLSERIALVAAISGRGAPDAARLIGLPKMIYVGNHGFERHSAAGSQIDPQAIPYLPAVAAALEATEREADRSGLRGLVFENKGATASIHYRLAPDPAAMRARLTGLLARLPEAQGLRVTEGRMVFELRPPVRIGKGEGVRALIKEYGLRGAVFLGDDVTDLDAMRELRQMTNAEGVVGVNIGVAAPEAPAELAAMADALVEGVDGVCALLVAVADRLEGAAR
jgi:trehalose 6-phosphate phosphatase